MFKKHRSISWIYHASTNEFFKVNTFTAICNVVSAPKKCCKPLKTTLIIDAFTFWRVTIEPDWRKLWSAHPADISHVARVTATKNSSTYLTRPTIIYPQFNLTQNMHRSNISFDCQLECSEKCNPASISWTHPNNRKVNNEIKTESQRCLTNILNWDN